MSELQGEELYEALRHWSEQCDRIDQAQLLWDVDSGFGGTAHFVSQYWAEEHQKAQIVAMPVADERDASDANYAASLTGPLCHRWVPVSGRDWPAQVEWAQRAAVAMAEVGAVAWQEPGQLFWGLVSREHRKPLLEQCDWAMSPLGGLSMEASQTWNQMFGRRSVVGQSKEIRSWLKALDDKQMDEEMRNAMALLRERL